MFIINSWQFLYVSLWHFQTPARRALPKPRGECYEAKKVPYISQADVNDAFVRLNPQSCDRRTSLSGKWSGPSEKIRQRWHETFSKARVRRYLGFIIFRFLPIVSTWSHCVAGFLWAATVTRRPAPAASTHTKHCSNFLSRDPLPWPDQRPFKHGEWMKKIAKITACWIFIFISANQKLATKTFGNCRFRTGTSIVSTIFRLFFPTLRVLLLTRPPFKRQQVLLVPEYCGRYDTGVHVCVTR